MCDTKREVTQKEAMVSDGIKGIIALGVAGAIKGGRRGGLFGAAFGFTVGINVGALRSKRACGREY